MANKLLLIEDVEDLGRSGDVVTVKPGYARNFLIPKGLAYIATKNTLRMQERLQAERLKNAASDRAEAEAVAKLIDGKTHSIEVKVDPEGHMYGSVSVLDIVHLIKEKDGIEIEKRAVQLAHAIKSTGVHDIVLKLKEDVTASFKLKIFSEHDLAAEAAAKAAAEAAEAEAEAEEEAEEEYED